ncbi:MAG: hypothetical protein NTY03_04615, partial [Candidatus Bathyarchaeota archaeon]|nr:hypothetical protein [Candidatus Bathyarchaeota archaeon]
MPLNSYQKMCYRRFGSVAENAATDRLKANLEKAHIEMRAGAYLACVWFNTILAAVVSTAIYASLIIFIRMEFGLILL